MSHSLPKRSENFAAWYQELVLRAGLAEHAAVRGCMVIKPYGYAIWERMQALFDAAFKKTGHQNVYFPLLIPKSYLSKEASHVEGFAKECAVVTHYRLKSSENGTQVVVDPQAKLTEELIVRPTSEALIWSTYKKWIQSYRDLPLLLNQWSNVVRWEMRTKLFLRSAEFLWQEGHTAHATQQEATAEAEQMLQLYHDIAKEHLAMPLVRGIKTPHERFAGATTTYTLEALMQDGKALQAGTSHDLGQRFARAFDVTFTNQEGVRSHVWGTSWGITTRLIGALIMMHGDDKGLVLPPQIAPVQVVLIPIYKNPTEQSAVLAACKQVQAQLLEQGVRMELDQEEGDTPGYKFAKHELKGVPIRLALGPRDVAHETLELVRRDTHAKESILRAHLVEKVLSTLERMQSELYERALAFQKQHTRQVDDYATFQACMAHQGGFVWAHWDGTTETEIKIQEETKATIRCIPWEATREPGSCIYTGKPSAGRVLFAHAY